MLTVLEQREFPHASVRLFASERSAGTILPFEGGSLAVEPLRPGVLEGIDIALFSAGSGVSREAAPGAARSGTVVIDNSSAFRMHEDVPLVVPEVNPGALAFMLAGRRSGGGKTRGGIVANPNCSAIIMLVALDPIRRAFGVDRVIVSTYQAASGAGARGMDELRAQTVAAVEGRAVEPEFFHEPYAFNLFSHNTAVDPESGLNVEEKKMIEESRKIWEDPGLRLSPTCIRVPVMRAHAESINVTLKRPATTRRILEVLGAAPGVQVVDDRANNRFPTPLKASGRDDVLVGRVRPDQSVGGDDDGPDGAHMAFNLFVCGDQLRKGAALNAVQIAELFV
jgi:aspartate-semialdehyde dehydrogenase